MAERFAGSMRAALKVALAVSLAVGLLIGRAACTSAPAPQPAFGVAEPRGAAERDRAELSAPGLSGNPPDAGRMGSGTQPAATPPLARDVPAGAAPTASPASGVARGSGVAQLLSRSDPQALALLSSVERELHRDPPAEVHELIARYRGGAGRDRLRAFVQQDFPEDLPLRVLALRWIDDVFPDPARAPTEPKPPATGAPPRWIEPIQKR